MFLACGMIWEIRRAWGHTTRTESHTRSFESIFSTPYERTVQVKLAGPCGMARCLRDCVRGAVVGRDDVRGIVRRTRSPLRGLFCETMGTRTNVGQSMVTRRGWSQPSSRYQHRCFCSLHTVQVGLVEDDSGPRHDARQRTVRDGREGSVVRHGRWGIRQELHLQPRIAAPATNEVRGRAGCHVATTRCCAAQVKVTRPRRTLGCPGIRKT